MANKLCSRCGKPFWGVGSTRLCSNECRMLNNRESHARNRAKRWLKRKPLPDAPVSALLRWEARWARSNLNYPEAHVSALERLAERVAEMESKLAENDEKENEE